MVYKEHLFEDSGKEWRSHHLLCHVACCLILLLCLVSCGLKGDLERPAETTRKQQENTI